MKMGITEIADILAFTKCEDTRNVGIVLKDLTFKCPVFNL